MDELRLPKQQMNDSNQSFKVGKYSLLEKLGEGGFGVVRKAVNEEDGSLVAVKILDKVELQLQEMTQHVKKEVSLLTMLDHPNIVKGYEVLNSRTKLFLIMEYISGGDMHSALISKKKFSTEEAQRCFSSLMSCLNYCHEQGVFHRDLKPENLLFTAEGELRVCDFGLASVRELSPNRSALCHTIVGTEDFSPPEILQRRPYNGDEADMWSAGVLLYTMLSGHYPFKGRSPRELHQNILSCNFTFPTEFPEEPKEIVSKLLVPKGKDRLSAAQLLKHTWLEHGLRAGESAAEQPTSRKTSLIAAAQKLSFLTPLSIPKSLSVLSKSSVAGKRSRKTKKDISLEESPSGIQDSSFNFDEPLSSIRLSGERQDNVLYFALARANASNFVELFDAMRDKDSGIAVGQRRWRLKTYPHCFVGAEAVDWLCSYLNCSRESAVELGQKLLESGVWHHVCREHDFEDEYLFYRFLDDEPQNAFILNFRKAWRRGVIGPNPVNVAFKLINQLSALCEKHQALNDHRPVDVTGILRDEAYQEYLNAACELQAVDLETIARDDQRISFLVNIHNLWWMQARIHLGDFDRIDFNALQTRARTFKYLIDGAVLSLRELESCLFGSERIVSVPSSRSASTVSSRSDFSLLSPRGNALPTVLSRLVSVRKTGQAVCEILRVEDLDPLIHFVLSNSSPEEPTIRAIGDKEFNAIYLQKSAAHYLDQVLELDVTACIVSYPEKVERYRHSAGLEDMKDFVEVIAKLCTGLPVANGLRSIQRESLEQDCAILAVVKQESSYPFSLVSFAPRIGSPLVSALTAETPWMA